PLCAPGSQDAGDAELDHAVGMPFSDLQPLDEYSVNFVHCKAIFGAMPHTKRHPPAVPHGIRGFSVQGFVHRPALQASVSAGRLPQCLGLAASIAARLTIWPISLACSASDRICACTKSLCSRITSGRSLACNSDSA